jgi:uncharacterized membrane protein
VWLLAAVEGAAVAQAVLAQLAAANRYVAQSPDRILMNDYELILAVFQNESLAVQAMDELRAREEEGSLRLFNAATLAKHPSGWSAVKEENDLSAGQGSLFGALVGGLLGLLGGPAGAVIGAAAGAAAGGWIAGRTDLGFEDEFLDQIRAAMAPGTSALLLLVEKLYADVIAGLLHSHEAQIIRHAVQQDLIAKLENLQDE